MVMKSASYRKRRTDKRGKPEDRVPFHMVMSRAMRDEIETVAKGLAVGTSAGYVRELIETDLELRRRADDV